MAKTSQALCKHCGGRKYDSIHATKSTNLATRSKAHEYEAKEDTEQSA